MFNSIIVLQLIHHETQTWVRPEDVKPIAQIVKQVGPIPHQAFHCVSQHDVFIHHACRLKLLSRVRKTRRSLRQTWSEALATSLTDIFTYRACSRRPCDEPMHPLFPVRNTVMKR